MKTDEKKMKIRNENNLLMLAKIFWKFLLNFQNDYRKSTMNSLNLTTSSLPS